MKILEKKEEKYIIVVGAGGVTEREGRYVSMEKQEVEGGNIKVIERSPYVKYRYQKGEKEQDIYIKSEKLYSSGGQLLSEKYYEPQYSGKDKLNPQIRLTRSAAYDIGGKQVGGQKIDYVEGRVQTKEVYDPKKNIVTSKTYRTGEETITKSGQIIPVSYTHLTLPTN